jgi:hypothetical protein
MVRRRKMNVIMKGMTGMTKGALRCAPRHLASTCLHPWVLLLVRKPREGG